MRTEEMESLNLEDVEVEELERRLELAPTTGGGGGCPSNNTCTGNTCSCNTDYGWHC
jgi:hypothetical protein